MLVATVDVAPFAGMGYDTGLFPVPDGVQYSVGDAKIGQALGQILAGSDVLHVISLPLT